MTEGNSYLPWTGANERIVVAEMLRDPISGHWYECHELVKKRVQARAKNIPQNDWDDIVQDAMTRINRFLPTFQFRCGLRTWIFGIVLSCIIDTYRKTPRTVQFVPLPDDPHNDAEHESTTFPVKNTLTAEDVCIMRDDVRNALAALAEYVSMHKNEARNRRILDMVLLDGHSHAEAAQAVGCSAPVASYVVREAQRYVREKLGYHR